ncbi:hypothetical protein ACS0TY_009851 [Phlomoides rotata]
MFDKVSSSAVTPPPKQIRPLLSGSGATNTLFHDRFVLDGVTCVTSSLLRSSSFGGIQLLEIEIGSLIATSVKKNSSGVLEKIGDLTIQGNNMANTGGFPIGNMLPFLRCPLKKYSQFNIWDVVATLVCLTGVTLAYFADSQLHNFVCRNQRLKILGQELVPNLDEGLWNYSCHQNYFGEQLWWWGLAIFAWNLDCRWSFIGTFINHLCLAYVTVLVEEYMLKQEYRAEAYKKYLIQSQYGYLGSKTEGSVITFAVNHRTRIL